MIKAVRTCFRKYVTFSGRATLSEFWYFILFMVLGMIALTVVNSILFGPEIRSVLDADGNVVSQTAWYNSGRLGDIFLLLCLLPWLAVTWRRMHDSDLRGFWPFLTLLLPFFGALIAVAVSLGWAEFTRQISETGNATASSGTGGAVVVLMLLLALVTNIYLLGRHSTPGPNRFGSPDGAATDPTVFE
ncbi:MAG: DUF805 domain-containing protein [Rhodobacteraceae bacterium]|nr:DUF805 domain-containing protein [Paracoccaceae bacterium]